MQKKKYLEKVDLAYSTCSYEGQMALDISANGKK